MSRSARIGESFRAVAPTAAVAVAAGIAAVAGSYGAAGFTPAFVVAPVEVTLSRLMPGRVVTFAITVLGDLGQQLNLAFATLLVVLAVGAVTLAAMAAGRRLRNRGVTLVGTAAGTWGLATLVAGRPVLALGAAAGASAVVGVALVADALGDGRRVAPVTSAEGNARRRVVSALAAAGVAGVLGGAVGRRRTTGSATPDTDDELTFDVGEQIAAAEARSFDIGGMDPAISEGFYEVDIASVNPNVATDDWTLSVTGEVEESFELGYDELREMAHEHRFSTIRCVGDSLNGHKMDTAIWTGVPAAAIIERAGPTSECECVMLRAEGDGFYEEFPLAALRPGMLAYGMNGSLLPRGHGAPVRAIVPGHWGEVNVKWLTEIEFLEREVDGYWEERNWHGTGPVKTVAKVHGTQRRDDGQVVVGGHAYAGTRGISEVEVSVDGGPWETAELTDRLPGAWGPAAETGGGNTEYAADAWRSWRYVFDPDGSAEVTARAYERDGTRQPEEATGPFPDGPAGWVTRTVDPGML